MTQEEITFFDRLAPVWDEQEILSTPARVKSILKKLSIGRGMDILDLGTGTGILIPYLHDLIGNEGNIAAVDISEGMISRAVEKYGHLHNVRFIQSDFESSALPGGYDRILLYSVYPHLHQPEQTLKKLLQANLKPNGRIVIAFPTDEHFINNIHSERKAESDLLPPASLLAERLRNWGLDASVTAESPHEYIVEIKKQ